MANPRLFTGEDHYIDKDGYKYIKFEPDSHDPYKVMFTRGYAPEHRVAMAMHLKRVLAKDEHVNHKDRNRINNDLDNLIIINAAEHLKQHREEGHFKLFSSDYQPHRGKFGKYNALKKQASKALYSLSGAAIGASFPFLLNYLKNKKEDKKDLIQKSLMGAAIGGTAGNVFGAYQKSKNQEGGISPNAHPDVKFNMGPSQYLLALLPSLPGTYKEITAKTDKEKEEAKEWLKRGALLSALSAINIRANKV